MVIDEDCLLMVAPLLFLIILVVAGLGRCWIYFCSSTVLVYSALLTR